MTLGKGATDAGDVQEGQGQLRRELWTMMIMGQMTQYRMSVMKLIR